MAASKTATRKNANVTKTEAVATVPVHVPLKDIAKKDMSPDAIRQRRSEAQKNAHRMQRTTTVMARAAALGKLKAAGEGELSVHDALKNIWSSRGEIVVPVSGMMVEVKRSDVVRALQQLPRDAKSPVKLVASKTDNLVHILEGA